MRKYFIVSTLVLVCNILLAGDVDVTWHKLNAMQCSLEEIGQVRTVKNGQMWSIGCECLDRDYGNFEAYKPYLRELGAGHARIQSGWAKTEKKKGKYDFAWLDKIVDGIIEEGLEPWITLCYGNTLYAKGAVELGQKIFTDEQTMDAWCNYVKATVAHYKGKVKSWEVWNEPPKDEVEAYVNLLIKTSDAIRSVDPDAYVIGFASTSSNTIKGECMEPGLKLLSERGRLDVIDAVSYHCYFENPDWGREAALKVLRIVAQYSDKIEVVQGEGGCPSQLQFAHAMATIEWTEYSQAKWVMRRMANDFVLNMRSNLFTFVDLVYDNPDSKGNFAHMQQSYGFLRTNNAGIPVYKRPSFYAFGNMVSIIAGLKVVPASFRAYTSDEFSLYALADESGKIVGVMMWKSGNRPGDSLEKTGVNVEIENFNISYNDHIVYVEPITGKVYNGDPLSSKEGKGFGKLRMHNIPVWDSPVFIFSKEAFSFTNR